jgi:hypothetical protein
VGKYNMGLSQKLKILSVIVCITSLYSCQSGSSNPQNLLTSSNTCPDQPTGTLDSKDVKPISINNQSFKASDTIGFGQNLGYSFDGKAGDKLSWKTSENICIWVFAPSTKLLKGNELTENGKHIIQVSVPTGRTTFTLEMGLGNTVAASTPVVPVTTSPVATTSQPANNPVQPTPTNTVPPVQSNSTGSSLTQDQAVGIVQGWLNSKGQIFGRPFNRQLARQFTTGSLYYDIAEKPNGSIDWLRNNNSYYTYSLSRVDNVWAFDNSGSNPTLKVKITEDRTLYSASGNIDYDKSGRKTANYVYYFSRDNNGWKINDYRDE